jgi:hypothetical protein
MDLPEPLSHCPFGRWSLDEAGLPCFDLDPECAADLDAPLEHLLSTGAMTALVNRWGDLRMLTCAGGKGQAALRPAQWFCLSDLLFSMQAGEEFYALLPGQWDAGRRARWGVGYAGFSGGLTRPGLALGLELSFIAPWDGSLGIAACLALVNRGAAPLEFTLRACAQIAALDGVGEGGLSEAPFAGGDGWAAAAGKHPELGRILLFAPDGWSPARENVSLVLSRSFRLEPGQNLRLTAWAGCALGLTAVDLAAFRRARLELDPAAERLGWAGRLPSLAAPREWIEQECRWSAGQLLAFSGLDGSRGLRFIHLGGYGWGGFGVRECAETALALADWSGDLALESLRWMAGLQWPSGDIPKGYAFNGALEQTPQPVESDNEIWFLLALGETVRAGLPAAILDLRQPFADGRPATLWEHARAAWIWLRDHIGIGPHGLVKIWHGDWDDYMNSMGRLGVGESSMNTGMACRALDELAGLARARGEADLAAELEAWTAARRQAMLAAFDRTHFVRGYTDQGRPVGGHAEGRVHLNAQTWAVLGRCGTQAMRQTALATVLRECATPIGLTLINKAYPAPPPAQISWAPIPPGEGENGGIWPQTVHWAVWALAEAGLTDEARRVWAAMSLRNHMTRHSGVPYGIWNGPDCYSSRLSGAREGRTQRQILDRFQIGTPMNPAVAWQAFSWRKILAAAGAAGG